MSNQTGSGIKVVATNRRARHDFALLETYEAGIVLQGTEIKSIRNNKVDLKGSFVKVISGELWLMEANIAEYDFGNRENHEPKRSRKLLMHRKEIEKIYDKLLGSGLALVPTRLYLKRGKAKLEFALARGKKQFDKRQDKAKRDAQRQIDRAIKERSRY